MSTLNYDAAPNNLGPSLQGYIEHRVPLGGFMTAVLSNDLRESMGRADEYNRRHLFELVSWLYNEAPASCWGSPERVRAWLNPKKEEIDQ